MKKEEESSMKGKSRLTESKEIKKSSGYVSLKTRRFSYTRRDHVGTTEDRGWKEGKANSTEGGGFTHSPVDPLETRNL